VSATFGDDIWDAKNFGQIIYAIRTRNGPVYLKLKKMYGDLSALQEEDLTDEERQWRREQAGGNVGLGTRQIQERNYKERKKIEQERMALFNQAIQKFERGEIDSALIDFENVISTESSKQMRDDFSRTSEVGKLSQYNAACCYSMLGNIESSLEALDLAFRKGFDDFRKAENDPNLANVRESEEFSTLVNKASRRLNIYLLTCVQYDESFLNENAMKVIRGIFSFGKND